MVISFIFLLHIIFLLYLFIKKWKHESVGSALIDIALIIILFSVGWSVSMMVCKIFWEPIGFGKHFDRDTISLFLLTVSEFFFYRFYFKDIFVTADGKEK